MPVQVQTLIKPEYTAVVTVGATAEVMTEAQLIDTAVALGNRTEYVRELVQESASRPEVFVTLREEFWGAVWDDASDILYGDLIWRTEHVGSPAVAYQSGDDSHPGQLSVSTGASSEFYLGMGAVSFLPFGIITTELASFAIMVDDDPSNLATTAAIGLARDWSLLNGGTDSIRILYQKTSPTWRLIVRKAGVQTTIDTGVTVVYGEFIMCRLIKNGNDLDVEIDGDIVHTVLQADRPTGSFNLGYAHLSSVADPDAFNSRVDFISVRRRMAGSNPRSGA